MSINSILCLFSGSAYELNALGTAFNLTRTCRGRLRVTHIAARPPMFNELLGDDYVIAALGMGSSTGVVEENERDLNEGALHYVTKFSSTHRVKFEREGEPIADDEPRVAFRTVIGNVSDCVPKEGRSVDLVVVGYDNSPDGNLETVLTALFQTGCPVLTLPRLPGAVLSTTGFAQKVAVAWDGSLTASRALRAALPYLEHADAAYLVSVEGMSDPQDIVGDADILGFLSSHGVAAEFVHCERYGYSIGHIILEKAKALGAELLVMGAYGHGHIGEMIIGGVTDHLLKHSRLPLLLAR